MVDSFFKNDMNDEERSKASKLDASKDNTTEEDVLSGDSLKTEESRMAALLSYLPVLCFIPLLNQRESNETRLHARQGVLLFLIELVALIFLVDGISRFVFRAILIVAVGFSLVGIIFALQGRDYKLPLVGKIAEKTKL